MQRTLNRLVEVGVHEATNGLLLRKDIHGLFDFGYVTVTPDLHFEVSGKVREEFENGREYYAMHGKQVVVPKKVADQPDTEVLSWQQRNNLQRVIDPL